MYPTCMHLPLGCCSFRCPCPSTGSGPGVEWFGELARSFMLDPSPLHARLFDRRPQVVCYQPACRNRRAQAIKSGSGSADTTKSVSEEPKIDLTIAAVST